MRPNRSERVIARDGRLFVLVLGDERLRIRLFGVITIGRLHLEDIRYIRQRGGRELMRLLSDSVPHPWRCWYWPRPGVSRNVHRSTAFVIRTQSGRRIYVRLRPGFYHRLRLAIGASRLPAQVAAGANIH